MVDAVVVVVVVRIDERWQAEYSRSPWPASPKQDVAAVVVVAVGAEGAVEVMESAVAGYLSWN